ncbi:T9SS type A sorting domain-containing protein [bacterium]|nr:T9SS type A sorting domain-containing protein [bacterium]
MEEFSGVALSDESGGIFVNFNADPSNGLYESYNYESDSLNRLYVHVADHTSEDVYFGFNVRRLWFVSCGSGNVAGNYTATSGNVVYWRLRDPNGNAVDSGSIAAYNGGTTASTTTGYIGNYTQANNGPDGVDGVGTTGYTPETYNPTVNGDYYFEFNYGDQISPYDASACSRSTIDFQYFDITVVDGTSSIQGRVWSRQWSLVSVNRAPNQSIAANSSKIHVSSAGSPGSSIEDTDGDGIPDSQDLDSDNDGITDLAENPDGTGVDANNDGIVDGSVDADRDGIIESADTDDNTDGSPGSDPSDRDSDGIADAIDLDSDNDGITDLAENPDGSGIDSNNDGIVDGSSDSDGDGILNSADSDDSNAGSPNSEPTDTDGDGLADAIDLDSDNDGITDLAENPDGTGTDSNNDGVVDGSTDSDNDGILNSADNNDSADGSPNTEPTDSDNDGIPDAIDLDSDNDGITDLAENTEGTGTDANNNGIVDGSTDSDGDGILNSADSDDSNAGTPNSPNTDMDGDGLPNSIDIDSDNDGITDLRENIDGSGTDANNDGVVDGATDSDGDGILNSADSNDGAAGSPNSDPTDTDSDNLANPYDIDSDDDGIVDLIEAQLTGTGSPTIPGGTDTDGDGLDNNFESTGLVPIDTDGDTTPDYLDSDSDDDGEDDILEGWDTDGDGTADTSPANSDSDGDGLDDNFDDYDNSTPSETLNSTNNSQDALDFPNEDEGGDERDWREEPCAGGTLALSPVNTTTTASVSCRQGAWTYYYNPADSTELLFAIEHFPSGAGNNTNEFTATVSLTVSSDPDAESGVYSATDVGNEQATFVMGRYWNVSITSGSLNGNVNIRYYFDPNDSDTLQAVAERWNDANANSTSFVSGRRWFTMNSGTFDPGTGDLTAAGINASQELFPSSQSTEDGIDYVQFNGLSSLTGGGQAYTIGENSVILPVELLEYKAQLIEDEVLSSWITATEINSDYFEIERSIDKLNWDVVGTVGAAGNSNRELYYQHFDTKPLKGVSYYRLKSIDLNQSFEYSQVEVISIGLQSGLALVYPNPNMGTFNVSLTDPSTVSSIEIYSSTGQLVRRMSTNGKTEFTFSGMANGYYNLSIVGTNER